jgi:peroxiredoxin
VRARAEDLAGAEVVAIGTGSKRYAAAFIEDESFPFPVLLDSEATAAGIVETNKMDVTTVLKPVQWVAGARALAKGKVQRKTGARPFQLGATFVIGPDGSILYEDREDHAGDHAPIDEVVAAVRST